MQIDDFKFRRFRSIHLWVCLGFWASNFGMSSGPQLTRNEKHWRMEITTTGCMGADFEAALQQGNKVSSNVNTKTSSFGWFSLVPRDQLEGIFPQIPVVV